MRFLAVLALAIVLSGCAAESNRVEITVRNNTARKLRVKGVVSGLSRTLTLEPGAEWTGWIPRASARMVSVEIEE